MTTLTYSFGDSHTPTQTYSGAADVDVNGDGHPDGIYLDFDGSGQRDSIAWDSDGDGRVDAILVSSNHDGVYDTVYSDPDGNGHWDHAEVWGDGSGPGQPPAHPTTDPAPDPTTDPGDDPGSTTYDIGSDEDPYAHLANPADEVSGHATTDASVHEVDLS